MAFAGVSEETLTFLRNLSRNNEKAWFQAHRDDYQALLMEPARDLVEAIGEGLRKVDRGVHAEPKVGGSIARINRDIRFSNDKRPYKDHLDLWFWQGRDRKAAPGYWFRLTPARLMLGAGMHDFGVRPDLLEEYRNAVVDPRRGKALERALDAVRAAGPYEIGRVRYKRVPRGYDAEHPRAALLLYEGLHAGIDLPVPKELSTPKFPAFCVSHYRNMAPVNRWLVGLVGG